MTDNEIIKALECCHQVNGCERCPLRNDTDECEILNTYALDLLLRQKAEIERLKEAYAVYEETTGLKWARAEAIKKFAERANEKLSYYVEQCGEFAPYGMAYIIDTLVKEMTEDGK